MKSKKILYLTFLILLLLFCLYISKIKPYIIAVKKYKNITNEIKKENNELEKAVKKVQNLIDENPKIIDNNVISNAKDIIKEAKSKEILIDKMPYKTSKINMKIKKLNKHYDNINTIKKLNNAYNNYVTSKKQYIQLTNPTKDFIIKRLLTIDEISDARAVTEEHDPNGNLNKPGAYTATVYFESKNVNQTELYETDLIGKGTDAGGAIEVYAKESDVKKREEYLSSFDGSILASGSHRVIGTVLIRTSDKLTASQQISLETKIIQVLSKLE